MKDVTIDCQHKDISVVNVVSNPGRVEDDQGNFVDADRIQLKLLNQGTKVLDSIECDLEYLDTNGEMLGFDSDDFFGELKPGRYHLFSIPIIEPRGTQTKTLTISADEKSTNSWLWQLIAIGAVLIILIGLRIFGGDV